MATCISFCYPTIRIRRPRAFCILRNLELVPTIPPFVAIEILSPDDRMTDVRNKLAEYRAWGVTHVWLVGSSLQAHV